MMMLLGILDDHWRGNVIMKSVKAKLWGLRFPEHGGRGDGSYPNHRMILFDKITEVIEYSVSDDIESNLNLRQGEDGCTKMLLICNQVKNMLYEHRGKPL